MAKRKREPPTIASTPIKARRRGEAEHSQRNLADSDSDSGSSDSVPTSQRRRQRLSHIKPVELAFPRSAYNGYKPPLPLTLEAKALNEFRSLLHPRGGESNEYDFVLLEAFSVYRHPRDARRSGELAGLERLRVGDGVADYLLFDGILTLGNARRYVQAVPFETITVEGYGDPAVTDLSDRICVQSRLAQHSNIWYQLGHSSAEYERFHKPFVWLAEFGKHFVDYLLAMAKVTLDDFRFCFHDWLSTRHDHDAHFTQWLQTCSLRDFRSTVSAHMPYLWKECYSLETDDTRLLEHPVWGEAHPRLLSSIPRQPSNESKTVVTPFAYEMFSRMYFADQLISREVFSHSVLNDIQREKAKLGLTPLGTPGSRNTALLTPRTQRSTSPSATMSIVKGDVVSLDADPGGGWKTSSSTWYAYVQDVWISEQTQQTLLDILWLYEPHDTTLGAAYYPFDSELFLSDNCGCGREAIDAQHATGKVRVSWFACDPSVESGLFVRQKFRTVHEEGTDDFVSLRESDFQCRCGRSVTDFKDCRRKYEIGDTVLAKSRRFKAARSELEPALIVDFDLYAQKVVLRRLWRKCDLDSSARRNELLLTGETVITRPSNLIRKCNVRVFTREVIDSALPTGYDRYGAGDFYFLDASNVESTVKLAPEPPFNGGVGLMEPSPFAKLKGLGIFCGGGNFDRGLEDGGAVKFKYAVDWEDKALHSYRANSRDPEKTHCFLGSVDDYLALTMKGSQQSLIPRIQDIDLIAAGSPCPGFSALQTNKNSAESLCNASKVASVVSFVDIFCPQYCILENVPAMTAKLGLQRDQNVFAQILAALVAMGYQVQQFLMDAWSHGSSQERTRVFIVASAPGLEPFSLPTMTHAHPKAEVRLRALGKASNGRSFGVRSDEYTPLQFVSVADATADLPDIGDAQTRVCPSFPDHCTPAEPVPTGRARTAAVPVRPYGAALEDAVQRGTVSGEPLEFYSQRKSSLKVECGIKSYSRVNPESLFPTITTSLKVACGRTGHTLHWNQDRSLSVMELRRAMGFPDTDVLIGSPAQKVHIIGNSVDRKVSFTLGLGLRESWSNSTASRLPVVQPSTTIQLASPLPTDDDESDGTGEGSELSRANAFNDYLRAGASAPAGLKTAERVVLQAHAMVGPSEQTRVTGAGLVGERSESEDEEGDETAGASAEARFANRPIGFVVIDRI